MDEVIVILIIKIALILCTMPIELLGFLCGAIWAYIFLTELWGYIVPSPRPASP